MKNSSLVLTNTGQCGPSACRDRKGVDGGERFNSLTYLIPRISPDGKVCEILATKKKKKVLGCKAKEVKRTLCGRFDGWRVENRLLKRFPNERVGRHICAFAPFSCAAAPSAPIPLCCPRL